MAELPTWLGDASGTARGIWYLFGAMLIQLITAIVLGWAYALTWSQSEKGSKVLLGIVLLLQLSMAWWSVCRTANDKIDGFEKGITALLEAISTCLVLAGSILADQGRRMQEETGEPDLELLAKVLQLANASSQTLMAAVFLPMAITFYNSLGVPLVGFIWKNNGDMREIACQLLMTLVLLPYEVATTFLGCKGAGVAADVVGELEGTVVGLAASSADLATKFDADGSGRVSKEEFATAVAAMGFDAPRAALNAIFEQVDSDNSGTVSAKELKALLEEGSGAGGAGGGAG